MIVVEWKLSMVWHQVPWLAIPQYMSGGMANRGSWCQTMLSQFLQSSCSLEKQNEIYKHWALFYGLSFLWWGLSITLCQIDSIYQT